LAFEPLDPNAEPDKPLQRLSEKHLRFCEYYIGHLCASRAAREAGFGTTAGSIRARATRLMKDPMILEHIEQLKTERRERCRISTDMVIDRLAADAFGGEPGAELTDGRRASLRLLGMHLGMFVERREISGPSGAPIAITMQDVLDQVYGDSSTGTDVVADDADDA